MARLMKTDTPIVHPDDELVEMTSDDAKAKYMDLELAHLVCQHMKKDGKVPMHLYVTLAGLAGCSMGRKVGNEEQLKDLLSLFGELCIDAAVTTLQNKGQKPMQ